MTKIYKPTTDNEFLDQVAFIIFVAGFRYSVVKTKWPQIQKAFANFSVSKVANYTTEEVDKTMKADGMIKNRGKIEAIVKNARICEELTKEYGSVLKWIEKVKKDYKKDPLFQPSLEEEFMRFYRIGKQTSGWLATLHNAKGKYIVRK